MKKWEFESGHTSAEFKAKHMMVTWVRGLFTKVKGDVEFDFETCDLGDVNVEIDASVIWTGDDARDGHLKSPDFLDAENNPKITFKSDKVERIGGTEYKVFGNLTIRGITKPTVLDVQHVGVWDTPFWVGDEDKGPVKRAGFTGRTVINRHDFNVSWNDKMDRGGIVVGDSVHIKIDAEALLNPPS